MIVGLAFIAYASLQAAGAAVFSVFGRDTALSVGFSSGNRNMALLLAVLPAGVNPDIPLYFALGQLPIYVLPAALTPLYRRILRRK
jgi:BASS family bile acid:Na+ symporter